MSHINKNPKNLLLQMLGIKIDSELSEIAQSNFTKIVKNYAKYQKNPQKYFEILEKRLIFVGNKLLKKLSKLYDMTPNNTQTKESIINWDLHQEILKKKGTPIHITINFDKFKF